MIDTTQVQLMSGKDINDTRSTIGYLIGDGVHARVTADAKTWRIDFRLEDGTEAVVTVPRPIMYASPLTNLQLAVEDWDASKDRYLRGREHPITVPIRMEPDPE